MDYNISLKGLYEAVQTPSITRSSYYFFVVCVFFLIVVVV